MSRSNPTLSSPVQRHFKWSAGDGHLVWWDKDAKQEVEVSLPFRTIVLDQLSAMTGWSETNSSGIWSNEIRNMKMDELVVRVKAGVLERGLYEHIKDKAKSQGAKYAASVYIAYRDTPDSPWTIGNIRLSGAAVSPWFELRKTLGVPLDSAGIGIALTGSEYVEKNKTIKYYEPKFEMFPTTDADEAVVKKLDEALQKYLEVRLSRREDEREERAENADPMGHGSLPVSSNDIEDLDKPIDLSEIPF